MAYYRSWAIAGIHRRQQTGSLIAVPVADEPGPSVSAAAWPHCLAAWNAVEVAPRGPHASRTRAQFSPASVENGVDN